MKKGTEPRKEKGIDIHPLPPEKPPRAGAHDLKPMISAELKDEAIDGLRDGLRATRRYWDKGSEEWVVEPDYATRTRNIELILAYAEGRPVERTVKLTADFSTFSDKLAKLVSTPEGLRTAIALELVENPKKPTDPGRGTREKALVETEGKSGIDTITAQATAGQVITL